MLAWRHVFAGCLPLVAALFAPPGAVHAQGLRLDAPLPAELQGCVTAKDVLASYVHALQSFGVYRLGRASVLVQVRSHAGSEPGSTRLLVSARQAGRSFGSLELRAKRSDCDRLSHALGQATAKLARQTLAKDLNQPLLPLSDVELEQPRAAAPALAEPREVVQLGVGAGFISGVLPSAALGLQLQAATPNAPLSMRARATLLWPQREAVQGGEIETRAYELSLELCAGVRLPAWERLALRLCAGPRMGIGDGRGRNFPVYNAHPVHLFGYLGLTPEIALRLAGATWLQLGGGVAICVVRPDFFLGIDSERRSVELSNPAILRSELAVSVLQVF
jgi:hypothetical protein